MIKIAITDGYLLFSQGLKLLLETDKEFKVVGMATATTVSNLIGIVNYNQVDLVIVNIQIPIMTGLTTCKKLRTEFPHLKIIALSRFEEVHITATLKEIGVHGYIFKSSDASEFIIQIKNVYNGRNAFPKNLNIPNVFHSFPTLINENFNKLTNREIEIISLIKTGISSNKIASKLFISINTVKEHRKHILKKLDLNNVQELITFIIIYGFC